MSKRAKEPIDPDDVVKPLGLACQVCGELRSCEVIETLTVDVSKRFGMQSLVYMIIDHCFDRRECKQQALRRAKDFAAGE